MQRKADKPVTIDSAIAHRNVRRGIIGTVAAVGFVLLFVVGFTTVPTLGGHTFTAYLAEGGGLASGDDVVTSGLIVGRIDSVDLDGNKVKVTFKLRDGDIRLGDKTSAAVITRTVLGRRALQVSPAGAGTLDSPIPLSRTTPPYDVTAALGDLTTDIGKVDTAQLTKALETTGEVFRTVAPEIGPAISGVQRLSEVVARRDATLRALLDSAARVSGTLADRDQQIQGLLKAGASLLEAVDERRVALEQLLVNAGAVSTQISGLIEDNGKQTGPALEQLNQLLAKLNANRAGITHGLKSAGPLLRELGEVVSAFPGFNVYIPNLVATNLVPTVPQLFGAAEAK